MSFVCFIVLSFSGIKESKIAEKLGEQLFLLFIKYISILLSNIGWDPVDTLLYRLLAPLRIYLQMEFEILHIIDKHLVLK